MKIPQGKSLRKFPEGKSVRKILRNKILLENPWGKLRHPTVSSQRVSQRVSPAHQPRASVQRISPAHSFPWALMICLKDLYKGYLTPCT